MVEAEIQVVADDKLSEYEIAELRCTLSHAQNICSTIQVKREIKSLPMQ